MTANKHPQLLINFLDFDLLFTSWGFLKVWTVWISSENILEYYIHDVHVPQFQSFNISENTFLLLSCCNHPECWELWAKNSYMYMFHITLYISFSTMQDLCIIHSCKSDWQITKQLLTTTSHTVKAEFQPHLSK